MSVKGLAEGIIIQSVEDLWSENLREECIAFFRGSDFRACAGLAGMKLTDQVKLLNLVRSVIEHQNKSGDINKGRGGQGKKALPKWHRNEALPW